jgi:hypothetical protein
VHTAPTALNFTTCLSPQSRAGPAPQQRFRRGWQLVTASSASSCAPSTGRCAPSTARSPLATTTATSSTGLLSVIDAGGAVPADPATPEAAESLSGRFRAKRLSLLVWSGLAEDPDRHAEGDRRPAARTGRTSWYHPLRDARRPTRRARRHSGAVRDATRTAWRSPETTPAVSSRRSDRCSKLQ